MNEPETSLVSNTLAKSAVGASLIAPKLIAEVQQALSQIDLFVQRLEDRVTNGVIVARGGEKYAFSPAELPGVLGEKGFAELKALAEGGRAFLSSIGFKTQVRVKPSVLIGNTGDVSSAGAFVTPHTEHPRAGDVEEGATVTAVEPLPATGAITRGKK